MHHSMLVLHGDSNPFRKIGLVDGVFGGASPLRSKFPRAVSHNTRAFALPGIS